MGAGRWRCGLYLFCVLVWLCGGVRPRRIAWVTSRHAFYRSDENQTDLDVLLRFRMMSGKFVTEGAVETRWTLDSFTHMPLDPDENQTDLDVLPAASFQDDEWKVCDRISTNWRLDECKRSRGDAVDSGLIYPHAMWVDESRVHRVTALFAFV